MKNGAGKLKEGAFELIAAKKLIVYSRWLDLNNLGLMLLGFALEFAAAWFAFQYDAGSIAGRVAVGGLACQILSLIGSYGSPAEIEDGVPSGGLKNLLFTVRMLARLLVQMSPIALACLLGGFESWTTHSGFLYDCSILV